MKFLFLVLLLISAHILPAQEKQEYFSIDPSKDKVSNSLFSSITFMDIRRDTTYLGVVQVGLMNSRARVVPKEPMGVQLSNLLAGMVDSSAKNGSLLLVLRRFTFTEKTTMSSETGFFYMRADLYAEMNNTFKWLDNIDTIVQFKAMDVTKSLLRTGEKTITTFLKNNLLNSPKSDRTYTLNETRSIDSIQKSGIALYSSGKYVDGIYNNYDEFKNQQPGISEFQAAEKNNKLVKITVTNETGNTKKIDETDYYAVVHNGVPYVATRHGFYLLEKSDNDFYYTGKIKTFNSGAAMMFGLAGALIAGLDSEVARFKLDHMNGSFLYSGKPPKEK